MGAVSPTRRVLAGLVALVATGCFAHHEDTSVADVRLDAGVRRPSDASLGASLDAGLEGSFDAGPRGLDVGLEGSFDVGLEGAFDAGLRGLDAGSSDVDASGLPTTDGGVDAGSDAACPVGTVATAAGCSAVTPIAPCDVPGNVLHLEGDAWVFTGVTTIDDAAATFAVSALAAPTWMPPPDANTIDANVTLAGARRRYYQLELSTGGTGRALEVGSFEDAMRYPFSVSDGRNGLTLSSTGRGCNRSSGRFDVHRVVLDGTVVREVLVSFDFYCELTDLVQGCLHYVAP